MTDNQKGACLRDISQDSWLPRVLGKPNALLVLGFSEIGLHAFRIARLVTSVMYISGLVSCRTLAVTVLLTRAVGIALYLLIMPSGCRDKVTKRMWALAAADCSLAGLYVWGYIPCERYTLLAGAGMEFLHLMCDSPQRW